MIYTTERGVRTTFRPYKDLDPIEREEILEDYLKLGSKATQQKWNISRQTLSHLKFHYREALEEIEDRHFKEHGL